MNILLLAPFDLFPPVHGGSSVVHGFVKHAMSRHHITALISHLYSLGGDVDLGHEQLRIHYCPSSVFDRMRVLSFWANPHYYRAAQDLCDQVRPDVIQCEILWPFGTAWRLRRRYEIPLVWVAHNVEAAKMADLHRPAAIVGLVRLLESFACRHADRIITLSEPDRLELTSLYGAAADRVRSIIPGPDLAEFRFDARSRAAVRQRYGLADDDPLLTYVGNLQYEPNQHAVRWLASMVYPQVIEDFPRALFVTIGQGPERLAGHRRDRFILTGYLSRPELVAHLCATDVFVVPVDTASGIRVKIPEAAGCSCAIVATPKATQGLEFYQDDEVLRADTADQSFSTAVLDLLRNPALRRDMGQRARARTARELGWDRTLAAYEEVYAEAVASIAGGPCRRAT